MVRNPIWSSLIHFGQIWSKKIKNKTAIFILSVNVTTFYSNIFRLVRKSNLIKFDQVWSILDGSDPKKSKNKTAIFILFKNVTTLFTNIFWYVQPLKSFFSDRHTDARKPHRHRSSNSSLDYLLNIYVFQNNRLWLETNSILHLNFNELEWH